MPRKDRPAPLPDSIFLAKLGGDRDAQGGPEEIPVHNTFIQFAHPESPGDAYAKKHLSTAPAWVGSGSLIGQALQAANADDAAEDASAAEAAAPQAAAPGAAAAIASVPEGARQEGEAAANAENGDTGLGKTDDPASLGTPKKVGVPAMRYPPPAGLPGSSNYTEAQVAAPIGDDDDAHDAEAEAALREAMDSSKLPSLGSAKHDEGLCKRCCFFPKGRCLNGYNCEFCHFEHEKRKRKKKKKGSKKDGIESESEDDDEEGAENPAGGRHTEEAPSMRSVGLPLGPPPALQHLGAAPGSAPGALATPEAPPHPGGHVSAQVAAVAAAAAEAAVMAQTQLQARQAPVPPNPYIDPLYGAYAGGPYDAALGAYDPYGAYGRLGMPPGAGAAGYAMPSYGHLGAPACGAFPPLPGYPGAPLPHQVGVGGINPAALAAAGRGVALPPPR